MGTTLVDLQGDLHDDVEQDVDKQDPCGPPRNMGFPEAHPNKHVGYCNDKSYHLVTRPSINLNHYTCIPINVLGTMMTKEIII